MAKLADARPRKLRKTDASSKSRSAVSSEASNVASSRSFQVGKNRWKETEGNPTETMFPATPNSNNGYEIAALTVDSSKASPKDKFHHLTTYIADNEAQGTESEFSISQQTEDLEESASVLAAAHETARSRFDMVSCPVLRLPEMVSSALGWSGTDIFEYLTREPAQRNLNQDFSNLGVEYDMIHFKSDTIDKQLHRHELHYEIALAIHKLNRAEDIITGKHKGTIIYAISYAQLILLIDYLYNKDPSLETPLGSGKIPNKFPVPYEVHHRQANVLRHGVGRTASGAIYLRTIHEEHIIKAYEMLTAPSIIFFVQGRINQTYMASACFNEKVVAGNVEFDIKVEFTAMPQQAEKLHKCDSCDPPDWPEDLSEDDLNPVVDEHLTLEAQVGQWRQANTD